MMKTGRIYMDKLKAISMPTELAEKLKEKGWGQGSEVILLYNEDTNRLEILSMSEVVKAVTAPKPKVVGDAEGEICPEKHLEARDGFYRILKNPPKTKEALVTLGI